MSGPDDAPPTSRICGHSPRRVHTALSRAVGHERVNRVMACLQQLGDQIVHGGQDVARTARLQRICVARLVERSLRLAVVTHPSPFLYADNRRQGAIPESGHTMLVTWGLMKWTRQSAKRE
jgi:hypothetical protein